MRTTDSGRSMVEILGVLVIIGILSVAGILGYRWAMDKKNANEILSDVSFAMQEIEIEKLNTSALNTQSIKAFYNTLDVVLDQDSYAITISNVSESVCRILQSSSFNQGEIRANPQTTRVCNSDQNNQVYFYRTLKTQRFKRCETTADCADSCSDCIGGVCVDNDTKCGEGQNCWNGGCSTCPKGQIKTTTGKCIVCNNSNTWADGANLSDEECNRCPGERIMTQEGTPNQNCVGCTRGGGILATKEQCMQCPNRVWAFRSGEIQCYYCDPNVSILSEDKLSCVPQNDDICGTGKYWMAGRCMSCSLTTQQASPLSQWNKCLGDAFYDGNRLVNCADTRDHSSFYNSCKTCQNRYFVGSDLSDSGKGTCKPCAGIVTSDHLGCE